MSYSFCKDSTEHQLDDSMEEVPTGGDGHRSREIPQHRMEQGGMAGAFRKPSACGLSSMGEKTCGCLALALNDGLANPQPSAPTANGRSGRIIRSKE